MIRPALREPWKPGQSFGVVSSPLRRRSEEALRQSFVLKIELANGIHRICTWVNPTAHPRKLQSRCFLLLWDGALAAISSPVWSNRLANKSGIYIRQGVLHVGILMTAAKHKTTRRNLPACVRLHYQPSASASARGLSAAVVAGLPRPNFGQQGPCKSSDCAACFSGACNACRIHAERLDADDTVLLQRSFVYRSMMLHLNPSAVDLMNQNVSRSLQA